MSADLDLFGQPIREAEPPPVCSAKRKPTVPRGYAAPPGTGPSNETCRTCRHYARVGGHAKIFLKCALVKVRWTNGPGTDIKAGASACSYWEKPIEEPKP